MCALGHNMLTLQEGVPISTGTSSSDVLGIYFWLHVLRHVSGLWVKLTTADWVHHSYAAALTDCNGVSSYSPIFSTILFFWQHEVPLFLNEEILEGPGCPPHPFFTSLPKCLGMLEGQRWSLKLQHFLDGDLHRALAIEGACCSLYNALESTLLNHSGTVFKSYHSWGISWLCPWKSNRCFVETFVG